MYDIKNLEKFACSIAQEICDDTKRALFESQQQTFSVDCQGFDLDGTLIFPELQDARVAEYYEFQYSDDSYQSSDYQRPYLDRLSLPAWGYPDYPNANIWATCQYDFAHCSKCHRCKKTTITTQTVSVVEDAFAAYIQSSKARIISQYPS